MDRAGCQPPWSRVDVKYLPLCSNSSMLDKHSSEYYAVLELGLHALGRRTKCVMPCTFMEYKVSYSKICSCYDC